MAQSGYTPIQLYRSATASAAPVSGNLTAGEIALNYNTADMALYAKNSGGSVIRIMNNPSGLKYPTVDGTSGQVLKTDGAGNLSWVSVTSGTVTGSGTTNYVPKFTGSTALGDSLISDNGTNVNIGTTTSNGLTVTGNITAYYSDDRLKTRKGNIENALGKVLSLDGFHYEANEVAQAFGYEVKPEVGLSAQQVQAVLPEVVVPAPIDEQYLTVHYDRLIPLLVEAIKELNAKLDQKCECCK
jgi:hypothetical protein